MSYLIALIPALGWGLMPLITGKIGGSAVNQMFGIGAGATIVGIIAFIIGHPTVSTTAFWFSVVCGALWTIGQVGQFISFKRIGVSKTTPISTVIQLVGNSIIGAIIFGEWRGAKALTIGFVALLIVIIGALMTSVTEGTSSKKVTTKDFMFLLCTSVGYWIYSSFPKIPVVANQSALGIFLPEMLGILLGSVIYTLCSGNAVAFKQKQQYQNIWGGISWGCAALAYIYASQALGVTTSFVFGQMNVIVATIGGIFVLHEQKTKRELGFTIFGIILIIIGSILTTFA